MHKLPQFKLTEPSPQFHTCFSVCDIEGLQAHDCMWHMTYPRPQFLTYFLCVILKGASTRLHVAQLVAWSQWLGTYLSKFPLVYLFINSSCYIAYTWLPWLCCMAIVAMEGGLTSYDGESLSIPHTYVAHSSRRIVLWQPAHNNMALLL